MGCSVRTVHKERQPLDQKEDVSASIGTSKRGFRAIFQWKMIREKMECYGGWSCKGEKQRHMYLHQAVVIVL